MRYHFTADGRLTAIVDRNGNRTTFTRSGDTLTISDAQGRRFVVTYSGVRIRTVRDPLGSQWTYDYSPAGNLIAVTDPRGGVNSYEYDEKHRLIRMAGPRQERGDTGQFVPVTVLELAYDWHGRVKRQQDGEGHRTFFAYFPLSRQTAVKDARGAITWRKYDDDLRITEQTEPPSAPGQPGAQQWFTYTRRHQLETHTDRGGRVTRRTYDDRRQPADGDRQCHPGRVCGHHHLDAPFRLQRAHPHHRRSGAQHRVPV